MPSDISMKIADELFERPPIWSREEFAEHLDSMGVGDAFALCKGMPSDFCDCAICKFAKEALRKAGLV